MIHVKMPREKGTVNEVRTFFLYKGASKSEREMATLMKRS